MHVLDICFCPFIEKVSGGARGHLGFGLLASVAPGSMCQLEVHKSQPEGGQLRRKRRFSMAKTVDLQEVRKREKRLRCKERSKPSEIHSRFSNGQCMTHLEMPCSKACKPALLLFAMHTVR